MNDMYDLDGDSDIAERGCGLPQAGGLYFQIETGPNGIDPRSFLIDPIPAVEEELLIKARGLSMIERDGIFHVVDHVGENNYPNFTDWFEETARLGFHQRVEQTLDFTKIDPINSRFLIVHPKGYIPNEKSRKRLVKDARWNDVELYVNGCPNKIHNWDDLDGEFSCCAGLSWLHIVKGEELDGNLVQRKMPAFTYQGFESIGKLATAPGFMASFPISMMKALIYCGEEGEHEDTYKKAMANGLFIEPEFVGNVEGDQDEN